MSYALSNYERKLYIDQIKFWAMLIGVLSLAILLFKIGLIPM